MSSQVNHLRHNRDHNITYGSGTVVSTQDLESLILQSLIASHPSSLSSSSSPSQYGLAPGSFPHYKHVVMPPDQMDKILAMHESTIYVAVVLGVYIVLLSILLCRYSRRYLSILLTTTHADDNRSIEEGEIEDGLPLTPPTRRAPALYTNARFGIVRVIGPDNEEKNELNGMDKGGRKYSSPQPPRRPRGKRRSSEATESLSMRYLSPSPGGTQRLIPRPPTRTTDGHVEQQRQDVCEVTIVELSNTQCTEITVHNTNSFPTPPIHEPQEYHFTSDDPCVNES